MYTEFVLDVTHINATIALIVYEHRQATSVSCAFFRSGEDEVDIRITIGNESLHTIQSPAVLLLIEGSLEHNALEVGTSIWFGEVH